MRSTTTFSTAVVVGTLLAMISVGCGQVEPGGRTNANGEPSASVPVVAEPRVAKRDAECTQIISETKKNQYPRLLSAWVDSADGDLSLLIEVIPPVNPDRKTATVVGLFRNNTDRPISVLKPLGDENQAMASDLELTRLGKPCRYIGPVAAYPLGERAFATIEPNEMAGHSLTMNLANFEGSQEDGEYRLIYRYSAAASQCETARRLGFEDLWTGEITSAPVVYDRGQDPPESEFERHVSIVFADDAYVFTLDEVAKGVTFDYQIDVERDFDDVVVFPQNTGGGVHVGPDGLIAFEEILGNGQSYSLRDVGLGCPIYDSARLAKGRYARSFEWDGRNWGGPSDYDAEKGPPFPAGKYAVYASVIGNYGTPGGRRFFYVDGCVPVTLKP